MKKILLIFAFTAFSLIAFAQQDYVLKPFDWSMHSYGNYKIQHKRLSPQGHPVDFVITNLKKKTTIFPLLDKNGHLQKVEGNFNISLWVDCIFIKSSDGYAKEFDGFVWMVPRKEKLFVYYYNKKRMISSYSTNAKYYLSGIYKIVEEKGKENLVPLLIDIDEENYSAVYPLGGLPYIVKYKDGESSLYDANFNLVNTFQGEIIATSGGFFLNRKDGFTEFYNENLSRVGVFDTQENGSFIVNRDGLFVWTNGKKNKVKVYDDKGNTLWSKDYEQILYCNGGPADCYLAVKQNGKWGAILFDQTIILPSIWPSSKNLQETIENYKEWSYSYFVNNFISKKGEFETTQHFQDRQGNLDKQQEYIESLNLPEKFVESFRNYSIILGPYDADSEEFPIIPTVAMWNSFKIKVPLQEAEAFKKAFMQIKDEALKGAKFCIKYDSIAIEKIKFTIPDSGKIISFSR